MFFELKGLNFSTRKMLKKNVKKTLHVLQKLKYMAHFWKLKILIFFSFFSNSLKQIEKFKKHQS